MATALPLNKFRVITKNLESGSTTIYQENIDISTILLSAAITNVTSSIQTVTVQVQKSGSASLSSLVYTAEAPQKSQPPSPSIIGIVHFNPFPSHFFIA